MPTFTVASFNALWGHTPDHRPFDVAAVVASLDADVVSVQEVWDPALEPGAFAAAVADLGYEVLHEPLSPSTLDPTPQITPHPDQATGTWGVALLSRLPVRSSRIVDLGRLVERWDVARRHAVLADVDVAGSLVTVAALHLSFVVPNAAAQLRRLGGHLPSDRPTVVAGDCNLWGPVARSLVPRHRRAVRGRTWPAHRPHSQLDHLLVSPTVVVRRAAVLSPSGSDHLPVIAELEVP